MAWYENSEAVSGMTKNHIELLFLEGCRIEL
jgi:hypothetical protein